ncbi:MAG: U32 family peptidase [Deltaproteobacteria bacterium]|nr:U32 family peptidase [Deltaproteobacteria bacterium]
MASDGAAQLVPATRPELLAPAGGPASWAAALEAGADAVYAGIDKFSARTYAENFTLPEIKGLIEESHRAGVKVYLAFNSIIKQEELAAAFRLMMAAAEIGADALIIQDLGLAFLARRHCPNLPLHASTLTAVHSLDGLKVLKNLGFTRAVLPRELSLREITEISTRSPIGVEVFIHGAQCFSFSGLCLMSSFLGGRSALRGGCTQPCRRAYQNAGRQTTFFSPADFMASSFIPDLKKLPIEAFKIEGRMKGPDYVGRIVAAYRLILDAQEADFERAVAKAHEMMADVPGRAVTDGGFISGNPADTSLWDRQTVSGLKLGSIEPLGPGLGRLTLLAPIKLGDRVRLVASHGEEGDPFKLKKILDGTLEIASAQAGQTVTIALGTPDSPPPEGQLYLVGSGGLEKQYLASEPVKRLKAAAKDYAPNLDSIALPPLLTSRDGGPPVLGRSHPLWFWLDGTKDLDEILNFRPAKIILPLTSETVKELSRHKKRYRYFSEFIWSFPPLIFGKNQGKIRNEAAKLVESGARAFMVSNLGQIALLESIKPGLKIWADHRLGVLNHLAAKSLNSLGLSGVTISIECDQNTITRLTQARFTGGVLMYLYGRPPLFTSRHRPPDLRRGPVVSPRGEKFWTADEGEAFILQSEHRVFQAGLLKISKPSGFLGFLVDLRREPNVLEAARRLKKAIDQGRGSPGLGFNFKRGLQ